MKARLFSKTGQLAGCSFEVGNEATIGKSPGNTIQLLPDLISGKHARVFFDNNAQAFFIEDLGSRNGTMVDGVPVRGRTCLGVLHVITLAKMFDLVFQVIEENVKRKSVESGVERSESGRRAIPVQPPPKESEGVGQSRTMLDDKPVSPPPIGNPDQAAPPERSKTVFEDQPMPTPGIGTPGRKDAGVRSVSPGNIQAGSPRTFNLEVHLKEGPKAFRLEEGETVVGRDSTCGLVLSDNSVSRRHAMISVQKGVVEIRDLDSKNGTFCGKERVTSPRRIQPGDQILIGNVKATINQKE
jgi:pSer/pThr/pTyr-binding forkhead associated (FHA) protein